LDEAYALRKEENLKKQLKEADEAGAELKR
jgi:hypothetical protein